MKSNIYIKGKWNDNTYKILDSIGRGGIARIFRVLDVKQNKVFAMKLSDDLHSISKERDMLLKFDGMNIFPKFIELDDYKQCNKTLYFITMEYIEGKNLMEYMQSMDLGVEEGIDLALLVGLTLSKLHKLGYIYGDLKLENIMIDTVDRRIRLIDLGGIVKIGKPVIEYTPDYDRAKWNKGRRLADEEYDMFALSIILINIILNKKSLSKYNSIESVIIDARKKVVDYKLIRLLEMGLNQRNIKFPEFIKKLESFKGKKLKRMQYSMINTYVNVLLSSSIIGFIIVIILNTVR